MRLEQAELYHLSMPLVRPFRTSFGVVRDREFILLCLRSEGLEGWGEVPVTARPGYSYETVDTAWTVLEKIFLPEVLGADLNAAAQLSDYWRKFKGHPMAKAGAELALWDLLGRAQGVSLREMIGGTATQVSVGVSIGIQEDLKKLLERIGSFLEEGYSRIKIKIEPGSDLDPVKLVRKEFPDIPLQVDANAAYTLDDSHILESLDEFGLLMIEQPFAHDDLLDHSRLQARLNTPLCLDESIGSDRHARQALELDAGRVINIKQARVGGLTEAVRIHDRCFHAGVPVWCGGLLESGVGRAANLALASLAGFTLPGDISATRRYYHEDVADPEFELVDGMISVPTDPGLGLNVMMDRIRKFSLRHQKIEA